MSDYKFIQGAVGGAVPISATATTKQFPLGYRAWAKDYGTGNLGVGQFVYCVGSADSAPSARGEAVMLKGNTVMQVGSASVESNFPVGIAAGAISATNVYGWVMVKGICDFAKFEPAATSNAYIAPAGTVFIGSTNDGFLATTHTLTATGTAAGPIKGIHPFSVISGTAYTAATNSAITVALNYPQINVGSAL